MATASSAPAPASTTEPNIFGYTEIFGLKVHPVAARAVDIAKPIVLNAAIGGVVYGIVRLFNRSDEEISPVPYVLTGVISAALTEAAKLAHEGALKLLGDRKKYETADPSDTDSRLDRFRQISWKVIAKIEEAIEKADAIFSTIFKIRTSKEIREQKAPKIAVCEKALADLEKLFNDLKAGIEEKKATFSDGEKKAAEAELQEAKNKLVANTKKIMHALDVVKYGDLRFVEILRQVFWEQVEETVPTVPSLISATAISAAGYKLVGVHWYYILTAVQFSLGLVTKVITVYLKTHGEKPAAETIAAAPVAAATIA